MRVCLLISMFLFVSCALNESRSIKKVAVTNINVDLDKEVESKLLAEVDKFRREKKLPSIAISIVQNGKMVWAQGFGKKIISKNVDSDIMKCDRNYKVNPKDIKNINDSDSGSDSSSGSDKENDVDANTIYRIGSVSKPIAALAVMKLVEEKKILLDKPISYYIGKYFNNGKDIPENLKKVTVFQVLTHTSGIRHYDYKKGEKENNKPIINPQEAMSMHGVIREKLLFSPGTKYRYSTYAYNLLQYLVESVSNKSYMDFLKENIFNPAGIERTNLDHPETGIKIEARPYRRNKDLKIYCETPMVDVRWKLSAGGIASTVVDLAKLSMALDSGKIFSTDTLKLIYTSAHLADGSLTQYGIGWHIFPIENGDFWVGHGGAATGGTAYLLRNPNKKISFAILTNLQIKAADLGKFANRLAQIFDPQIPSFKIGNL
ncbi:MAG: beta-lactamase family protein [Oligoflexia bacterium]|nr:beta-lactamase family protein [Oligoflexia bacterium]